MLVSFILPDKLEARALAENGRGCLRSEDG